MATRIQTRMCTWIPIMAVPISWHPHNQKGLLLQGCSMSLTIICVVHSPLLVKYSCVIMYASVYRLYHLTTRCSLHTRTRPLILYFYHVFGHLSVMREEGWIIQASTDSFAPAPRWRSAVRGTTFFCRFWQFSRYSRSTKWLPPVGRIFLVSLILTRQKNSQNPLFM